MSKLDLSDVQFDSISVHTVGNKFGEEGFTISDAPIDLEEETKINLLKSCLLRFNSPRFYKFDNTNVLNPAYDASKAILSNHEAFHHLSEQFAKHLYECSTHPKIKRGEIYVIQMTGVKLGFGIYEAIGVFKSESKLNTLEAVANENAYTLEEHNGFGSIDFGAIIVNHSPIDNYYLVNVYEPKMTKKLAKHIGTYWKKEFLDIIEVSNDYVVTEHAITFAALFIKSQLPEVYELSLFSKSKYLNRAKKYFQDHEEFDHLDFCAEVYKGEEEITDLMTSYREDYCTTTNFTLPLQFHISAEAFKVNKKLFKLKISLDKNFSLEIHGRNDFIEKGVDDEKGMRYYKIYYKGEKGK